MKKNYCHNCYSIIENISLMSPNCHNCQELLVISNYNLCPFELFNVAKSLFQNLDNIENKLFAYMSLYHPDKYINKALNEQRVVEQNSAYVNKIHDILINPERILEYLILQQEFDSNNTMVINNDKEILREMFNMFELYNSTNDKDKMIREMRQKKLSLLNKAEDHLLNNNQEIEEISLILIQIKAINRMMSKI